MQAWGRPRIPRQGDPGSLRRGTRFHEWGSPLLTSKFRLSFTVPACVLLTGHVPCMLCGHSINTWSSHAIGIGSQVSAQSDSAQYCVAAGHAASLTSVLLRSTLIDYNSGTIACSPGVPTSRPPATCLSRTRGQRQGKARVVLRCVPGEKGNRIILLAFLPLSALLLSRRPPQRLVSVLLRFKSGRTSTTHLQPALLCA